MKKILKVIVLASVIILSFVQISFAANEATIKISPEENVLAKGDSVDLGISVLNTNVTEGITKIYGTLKFDEDIFQIETIDYDTAIEEAESTMKMTLNEFKEAEEDTKLLYFSDDWCIVLMEQDGEYGIAALTLSDSVKVSSSYKEIGTITLSVIDSAQSGTTEVSLTDVQAEQSIDLADATTSSLTINAEGNADMEEMELLDEEDDDDEIKDKTNKSTEEAPYTGVEDVVPFIIIAAIIGIIGYIKYKKYQGI